MSNPILTTTNSKLDTRVKEPSGAVPLPSDPGSLDRFDTQVIIVIKNILYRAVEILNFKTKVTFMFRLIKY